MFREKTCHCESSSGAFRGLGTALCVLIQFSLMSPKHESKQGHHSLAGVPLGSRKRGRACRVGYARTPPPHVRNAGGQREPRPRLPSLNVGELKRMELELRFPLWLWTHFKWSVVTWPAATTLESADFRRLHHPTKCHWLMCYMPSVHRYRSLRGHLNSQF